MASVEKWPEANLDLYEIWEHIALESPGSADRVIRKINETFLLLAGNPGLGRAQDDLAPGLRSFPVMSWIIFYRLLSGREGIEVVRVLHGRRDIQREFGKEG